MKVQDVMAEGVAFCSPETNLAEAVALMWKADCGALPVVNPEGKLVGIITDRDIAIAAGTRNQHPFEINVGDVMSTHPSSCRVDDDIRTALATMRRQRVRRLPATDQTGNLCGIVSMSDVVLHAEGPEGRKTTGLTYSDALNTFKAVCGHHKRTEAQSAAAK
jgi:CBS domain-containing protein